MLQPSLQKHYTTQTEKERIHSALKQNTRVSRLPFDGLRDFASFLEANGELARITRQVNPNSYEVSAILERLEEKQGKAVIFENLKNHAVPLCASILGTPKRTALALETTEQKLAAKCRQQKRAQWPTPEIVSEAPCQEHTICAEEVNLFKFPILKWNPLDAGPYITLGVLISKDPETGKRNAGIYRLMVLGKNQLAVNLLEGRHAGVHYKKAEAKGQPLEVAVAVGLDPAVVLASAVDLEFGEDELALAGALRGKPVKLVKCKTVNVEVPAFSEIVLEGEMPPTVRVLEGPFGEGNGYYGKAQYKQVVRIKAVTHRETPLYQATYSGKPIKEEHCISAVNHMLHIPDTEEPFTSRLLNTSRNVYRRARLQLTAKKIELPGQDRSRVAQNWALYALD
jgi:UbiD family decarboxylase